MGDAARQRATGAGAQTPSPKDPSKLGRSQGKLQQLGAMLTKSSGGGSGAGTGHIMSASLGILRNVSEKMFSSRVQGDDEPEILSMRNPMLSQRKQTKVFDVGSHGVATLKLNTLSLTFQRIRPAANGEPASACAAVRQFFARVFDFRDFVSDFELEFQRFHAVQSLSEIRRGNLLAIVLSLFMFAAGITGNQRDGANKAWFAVSAAMLGTGVVTMLLLRRRTYNLTHNFRLQTLSACSMLTIALLHTARALLNPYQPMSYVYSIAFMCPFYLAVFAAGVGLTFPFFVVCAIIFINAHIAGVYHLRERYVSWDGHSADFLKRNWDEGRPELRSTGSANLRTVQVLHESVDFIWVYHLAAFLVFSYVNRLLEIRSRSHFIQLRRLNQLETARVKVVVDWGLVTQLRRRLKFKFRNNQLVPTIFQGMLGSGEWEIEFDALVFGEKVGSGASGDVFAGFFGKQPVAIKQLNIDEISALDPDAMMTEAKVEAQILAKLRHPNVLEFYGVCNDHMRLCIVTQLCTGDLRSRIYDHSTKMDRDEQQQILREIAAGCAYLHEEGVVHRDLKPGNVLLDKHGQCKICDFGQSKDYRADDRLEMTTNVGTPVYAAPELHCDERVGHYSTKIDVYSFGIIMWSLLTRERPYSDQGNMSTFSLVTKIVEGLRPTVSDDFPPMLAKLMARCWALDPDDRPMFAEILVLLDRSNLMVLKGEEPVRARGLSITRSRGRSGSSPADVDTTERESDVGDTATHFLMGARQRALRTVEKRRSLLPGKPSKHSELIDSPLPDHGSEVPMGNRFAAKMTRNSHAQSPAHIDLTSTFVSGPGGTGTVAQETTAVTFTQREGPEAEMQSDSV